MKIYEVKIEGDNRLNSAFFKSKKSAEKCLKDWTDDCKTDGIILKPIKGFDNSFTDKNEKVLLEMFEHKLED